MIKAEPMTQQEINGHKELATSVFRQAIHDLHLKGVRDDALEFLVSPARKASRALWLQWLGYTDEAFVDLMRRKMHQGNKNKLNLEPTSNQPRPGAPTAWEAKLITRVLKAYRSNKAYEIMNLCTRNSLAVHFWKRP